MNSRERILMILTGTIVAIALVVILFTKLLIEPSAAIRNQIADTTKNIQKKRDQLKIAPIHQANLVRALGQSFGTDEQQASADSRAHLIKIIERSGLRTTDMTMTPVKGRLIRGGRELGWIVRVKGTQDRVTNLLYLLQMDPSLHRVEGVTWSKISKSTDVDLQFRFMTIAVQQPVELTEAKLAANIKAFIEKHGIKDPVLETPVRDKPKNGAVAVRWKVKATGDADTIADMLDAASMEPLAYRVDEVIESEIGSSKTVSFTWVALLPDTRLPVGLARANDKQRDPYDLIAERDIFRPYIRRPPPPPPRVVKKDPPKPEPKKPTPPPKPRVTYRVIGLPTWGDRSEVVVQASNSQKSQVYQIGEDLMGGEILMVDYRPLPHPRKPKLLSTSRVIVRIGRLYYALELGQTFAEKRLLLKSQYPAALLPRPEPEPQTKPAVVPAKTPTSDTTQAQTEDQTEGDVQAVSTGDATGKEEKPDSKPDDSAAQPSGASKASSPEKSEAARAAEAVDGTAGNAKSPKESPATKPVTQKDVKKQADRAEDTKSSAAVGKE